MRDNCFGGRAATHELLHAVGFWHEQSREDRDNYVTIHWENIDDDEEHNFEQHISDGDDIGIYDYQSIMQYFDTAFSTNGQRTISRKDDPTLPLGGNVMSSTDINTLQEMYGELQKPDLNVNYHFCYGQNSINWASYLDNADFYQIQLYIDGAGFVNSATTTSKAYQVNVTQDTLYRIRACKNSNACSDYSDSVEAEYRPICM